MAEDGLLDPAVDLNWLIDTTTILAAAETYLLITRLASWDLDAYQDWLTTTSTQLSTRPAPRPRRAEPAHPDPAAGTPQR